MEPRDSKLHTVVIIVLSILATVFLIKNINILVEQRELKDRLNELSNQRIDPKEVDKKIEEYSNIDTTLANKREEYYSNIRKLEDKILSGESDKKIAYLTFDDGPYQLTYQVLDILKENNVKATFFVLGKDATDRYQRIVNEGHTLGNHTYYHNINSGLYYSTNSFMNQVDLLENYLYNQTGYRTNLVRFPGGSDTAAYKGKKDAIVEELHNKGYKYVDWTCETGDGSDKRLAEKSEWEWYKDTCKDQNIMVLLMHDYNQGTIDILPNIIKDLRDQGYILLPLTNKSVMAK